MIIGLVIILLLALVLPFTVKRIEHNLELFLLVLGTLSIIISGEISKHLLAHVFSNKLLYMITFAVFIAGIMFKILELKIKNIIGAILETISIEIFVFFVIIILGILSSVITAIIASLFLVQIINNLPLTKQTRININIITCLSIGIGAALTPIGEPISTIVVSKLNADFLYIYNLMGGYIFINVLFLAFLGSWIVGREIETFDVLNIKLDNYDFFYNKTHKTRNMKEIFVLSGKIFIFIVALELLGAGFKPLIDNYIIPLDSRLLYWGNSISAILDNATLAAAEISPKMTEVQIRSILMGLLISGGILIPGNIPNIVSSARLNITSREWMKLGIPLGFGLLLVNFFVLFVL